MDIKKALSFIQKVIENSLIATVRAVKQHTYTVKLDSNKVEVSNPVELPKEYPVRVLNPEKDYSQEIQEIKKVFIAELAKLQKDILSIKPSGNTRVTNLKDIKIPEFPEEIKVSNQKDEIKIIGIDLIEKAISEVKKVIEKLPTKYPEFSTEMKVKNFSELQQSFAAIVQAVKSIKIPEYKQADIHGSDPKKYIPVRLTDGKDFYNALEQLRVATTKAYAYSDSEGVKQQALVDSDRHVQVDVLTMPPIEIPPSTGGATEAKQDDIIAAIGNIPSPLPDNHQVTVSNQISTAGLASEEGQANIVQAIENIPPTDTSSLATAAKQLPDNHQVSVSNHPTEFPLPDAQVEALTPPPAITGFATATKQDTGNTSLSSIDAKLSSITKPTDIQSSELITVLRSILQAIQYPGWLDRSANAIRNQVQSGTITAVTTVTTCTTVTGLTNIDSYQGKLLPIGQNMAAWALSVRARIT